MSVEIIEKTKDGKMTKEVKIEKMSMSQTVKVSNSVGQLLKFINDSEQLRNVFKTFNEVREEEKQKAVAFYKEQKAKKVKDENIEEYDIGGEALARTGTLVWNDLISVLADMLGETPDVLVEIVSDASGIKKEIVDQQEPEVFIDILQEVIDNNDIQAVVERIKKLRGSLGKVTQLFQTKEKQ